MSAELLKLERLWLEAFRAGDHQTLEQIWADDFLFTDPDGAVLSRRVCLDAMRDGTLRFDTVEGENLVARELGDTGVVVGSVRLQGRAGNRHYDGRYSILDVYARRNGRWLAVLSSGECARVVTPA